MQFYILYVKFFPFHLMFPLVVDLYNYYFQIIHYKAELRFLSYLFPIVEIIHIGKKIFDLYFLNMVLNHYHKINLILKKCNGVYH